MTRLALPLVTLAFVYALADALADAEWLAAVVFGAAVAAGIVMLSPGASAHNPAGTTEDSVSATGGLGQP